MDDLTLVQPFIWRIGFSTELVRFGCSGLQLSAGRHWRIHGLLGAEVMAKPKVADFRIDPREAIFRLTPRVMRSFCNPGEE